jgi:SAM-dependent methyltransferase
MSTDPPATWFRRTDESEDATFYASPRLVAHIDPQTIAALTDFYRTFIVEGADVLDLMSSWISHLPPEGNYGRVAGLGMNAVELGRNAALTDWCVHDLNVTPELPYPDGTFDRVVIAVSIQYLVRPLEVMRSVRRKLRPGGRLAIAMSHRLFPTKAIAAFHELPPADRIRLVATFLDRAGFVTIGFTDASPPTGDPLWIVTADL